MPTDFMKVAGFPNLSFNAGSTTTWGNVRMRVAMALDNTGSMADDGKIAAMQTAAKSLDRQAQRARQDHRRRLHLRSCRSPRTSMSAPATTTRVGSTRPPGTPFAQRQLRNVLSIPTIRTRSSCVAAGKSWTPIITNLERLLDGPRQGHGPTRRVTEPLRVTHRRCSVRRFFRTQPVRLFQTATIQRMHDPVDAAELRLDRAQGHDQLDAARTATPTRPIGMAWAWKLLRRRAVRGAGERRELQVYQMHHAAVGRSEHEGSLVTATAARRSLARSMPGRRCCAKTSRAMVIRSTV